MKSLRVGMHVLVVGVIAVMQLALVAALVVDAAVRHVNVWLWAPLLPYAAYSVSLWSDCAFHARCGFVHGVAAAYLVGAPAAAWAARWLMCTDHATDVVHAQLERGAVERAAQQWTFVSGVFVATTLARWWHDQCHRQCRAEEVDIALDEQRHRAAALTGPSRPRRIERA